MIPFRHDMWSLLLSIINLVIESWRLAVKVTALTKLISFCFTLNDRS